MIRPADNRLPPPPRRPDLGTVAAVIAWAALALGFWIAAVMA
jgi:hypothetical protein